MKNTFLNTSLNCLLFFLLFFGGMNMVEGRKLMEEERRAPVCEWEAPQNLNATSITPVSVTLSWDIPITGAAPGGYQIKTILDSTGVVVNTTKTSGLSKTISGLTMGTVYRFEVCSICAGNEVSNRLVSNTIITVYVDEIINTDCPETPDNYTPVGSFYNGVINGGNTSDDIIAIPFSSSQTNNQLYFWYFYAPNNPNIRYTKFIIERDKPVDNDFSYHYKHKDLNGADWDSYLFDNDKSIRLINHDGQEFAKLSFSGDKFLVKRLINTNFSVKVDMTCVCNSNTSNPSCQIGTALTEVSDGSQFNEVLNEANYLTESDLNTFSIDFYPNPANNVLYFKHPFLHKETIQLTILDINGIKLKEITFSPQKEGTHSGSIDIESIVPGIYFILASTSRYSSVSKFVKTN